MKLTATQLRRIIAEEIEAAKGPSGPFKIIDEDDERRATFFAGPGPIPGTVKISFDGYMHWVSHPTEAKKIAAAIMSAAQGAEQSEAVEEETPTADPVVAALESWREGDLIPLGLVVLKKLESERDVGKVATSIIRTAERELGFSEDETDELLVDIGGSPGMESLPLHP